jgi:predicted ATPase/DNA-binding XRE family transcriptional regulator
MKPETFGSWLKQRRKELDLTQAELARHAGCAPATIRKLEAGTRRPSKRLLERLAQVLDIPAQQQPLFFHLARMTGDDELPAPSLSLSSPSPAPLYNLPAPLTPLIGREADVAAVRRRLLRPGVRLLTLIGPPGIGKTRLSLQAAVELRNAFPQGVVFVALAAVTDADLVLSTVARTLGLQESSGRSVLENLVEFLRRRQMLLVLDNFEQVVEAAPSLAELLSAAAGLKLLVTSRVSLRLYAEHKFPLPPLAVPTLPQLPTVEQLAQVPAVALFVQRAQAAMPTFDLTDENATAVAELCQWLDGVPLAIELAAARIELYSAQELLRRLASPDSPSSLGLLKGEARDVAPRHQTMTNAVGWSYQLLEDAERRLFRRLAVFAGGCTRPAAEAVCEGQDVTGGLASLLDKSLLQLANCCTCYGGSGTCVAITAKAGAGWPWPWRKSGPRPCPFCSRPIYLTAPACWPRTRAIMTRPRRC